MKTNYHIHTKRCMHAAGEDREYIEAGIKNGLKVLGISDHAPYFYPDGYVSYYKMTPDGLPEYVNSLNTLKNEYAEKIELHIGLEAEYYPELFDKSLELWRKNGIEYLVLGQHFIEEEWGEHPIHSFARLGDKELVHYTDLCIEALKTGYFSVIAHPDVLNYAGSDRELYAREAARLITAAIETDTPLEYNLLGMHEGRNYPNESFWEIASKLSPKVVIGCDAHSPSRVADPDEEKEALKNLSRFGITPIDRIELKPIK